MEDSRQYDLDFEAITADLRRIFGGDYPPALQPLGDAIKSLRIHRFGPRSQGKLATEAGIDASTVSRYESGKTKSTETEKLYAISVVLDVSLDRVAVVKLPNVDAEIAAKALRFLTDRVTGTAPDEFPALLKLADLRALRFGIPVGWQLGCLDFFRYIKVEQAEKHLRDAQKTVATLLKIDHFEHELVFDDIGEDINLVLSHYQVESDEKYAAICIGMSGARQACATRFLEGAERLINEQSTIEMRAWVMRPLSDLPARLVSSRESLYFAIRDRDASTVREFIDFMIGLTD